MELELTEGFRLLARLNDSVNQLQDITWSPLSERPEGGGPLTAPPMRLDPDVIRTRFDAATESKLRLISYMLQECLPVLHADCMRRTPALLTDLLEDMESLQEDHPSGGFIYLLPACRLLFLTACNLIIIHRSVLRRVAAFRRHITHGLFCRLVLDAPGLEPDSAPLRRYITYLNCNIDEMHSYILMQLKFIHSASKAQDALLSEYYGDGDEEECHRQMDISSDQMDITE